MSIGSQRDCVSVRSLAGMCIYISLVNLIGQTVCNYFNYIYSILNTAGNFPKCLFTNRISFGESWFMTQPYSSSFFAVKLTLCLHICDKYVLSILSLSLHSEILVISLQYRHLKFFCSNATSFLGNFFCCFKKLNLLPRYDD